MELVARKLQPVNRNRYIEAIADKAMHHVSYTLGPCNIRRQKFGHELMSTSMISAANTNFFHNLT